jgi:hypothetical protein
LDSSTSSEGFAYRKPYELHLKRLASSSSPKTAAFSGACFAVGLATSTWLGQADEFGFHRRISKAAELIRGQMPLAALVGFALRAFGRFAGNAMISF